MLVSFEKMGLKKVPIRLEVLKEIKTRVEDAECSQEDLITVIDAYPHYLNQKVSA